MNMEREMVLEKSQQGILKNQDGYGSAKGRNIHVIKGEHNLWVI